MNFSLGSIISFGRSSILPKLYSNDEIFSHGLLVDFYFCIHVYVDISPQRMKERVMYHLQEKFPFVRDSEGISQASKVIIIIIL